MSKQDLKLYLASGWNLAEETPEYYVIKKNTATPIGHILIVIFFWWTLGLANLLYWAVCNKTQKVMK